MSNKITYEQVVKAFHAKGFKVLSDEYFSNQKPLHCEDLEGYQFNISYKSIKINDNFLKVTTVNPYSIFNIKKYISKRFDNIQLLSETYTNQSTPLKFKCNCGNVFEQKWESIVANGAYCRSCNILNKNTNVKYDISYVETEIKKMGFKLCDSEYCGNLKKMKIKDDSGYLYSVNFYDIRNNKNIYKFSKSNPYTIENIKLYMSINNYNSTLLSDKYLGNQFLLKFKCHICGEIFERTFNSVNQNNNDIICSSCSSAKRAFNSRESLESIKSFFKENGLIVLDNHYQTKDDKLLCEDSNGLRYRFSPYYLKQSLRKGKTDTFIYPFSLNQGEDVVRYNLNMVLKDVNFNGVILNIEKWNDNVNKTGLIIQCECGEIFKTPVTTFVNKNKHRCNICNKKMSSLETKVVDFLNKYNIEYVQQKYFNQCRGKVRRLPFDFYIQSLNMCIECDGNQHFKPINFFGGKERFLRQKINDDIKSVFCKNSQIRLIRLSEKEFKNDNYIKILEKELNIIA